MTAPGFLLGAVYVPNSDATGLRVAWWVWFDYCLTRTSDAYGQKGFGAGVLLL